MSSLLRSALILTGLMICGSVLEAQRADFGTPATGFFYDQPSRSIRPILGVPGSAIFGAPVVEDIDFGSVAPQGKMAIVGNKERLFLYRGLNESPESELLEGAITSVDLVAWSSNGSMAVLYSSASRSLQRLRKTMDGGWRPDTPEDLDWMAGPLTTLVAGNGGLVALGVKGDGVYFLPPSQSRFLISPMADPVSAVLDATGERLFVADRETRTIFEFSTSNWSAGPVLFQNEAGGVSDPLAMAFSQDGRYLYLINDRERNLIVYGASTRAPVEVIALECAPTALQPLAPNGVFLLRTRAQKQEPLWVVDGRRQAHTVYFVPPGEED